MAIDLATLLGLQKDPSNPFPNNNSTRVFNPVLNQSSIPQGNPLDPSTMQVAPTDMAPTRIDPMTEVQGEDVLATAKRIPPVSEPDAPTTFQGNREILRAALDSLGATQEFVKDSPTRSGMFGIKGTLRDILGTLGDAFLVQGGGQAVYQPQRQQERMADAMAGFSLGDPASMQASIERLSAAGFGKEAQALFELASQNTARQAATQQAAQNGQVNAQEAADKRYADGVKLFAQMAGAVTPKTFERLAPAMRKIKERAGLGDEFIIPDTYDPELFRSYQYGGMPASNQVSTVQREQQLGISQQNADANTTRAQRAPQPRAEPNPTAASIAAPLLAKVARGERLTPGEQDTLDRTAPPPARRPRSVGTAPPPPASRFRRIN